jgi:hypothetical protein
MKRLIRFVAFLYPMSWRARYGVEFEALLEDLDPDWRTFLDTVKGALEMRINTWNMGKILAATGIAGMVIGLAVSLAFPRQYASTAVIKIVPSSAVPVTHELVANHVNRVAYGVMSRPSLTSIIDGFGLYRTQRAKEPREDIIDDMRTKITVRPETPKVDAQIAFIVQFVYTDPVLAQQVTQQLVARFVDENLRVSLADKGSMTFEIIDAASLPRNPLSPSWWKLSTVGLLAGMFSGITAVLLRHSPKLA